MKNTTRRFVLAASAPAVVAIAACGASGGRPGGETKSAAPREMTLLKATSAELVDNGWRNALEAAGKATNVKVTLVTESSPTTAPFWEKRQNEFAAGGTCQ